MSAFDDIKSKGTDIDRYRVMGEIGRGAASVIYLVQDTKSKAVYALKHVKKVNDKDQRFLDQAEAEYKIAQNFDHAGIRHIPRLFKLKQKGKLLAVGELYLVMEFVDGVSMVELPPKTFEDAVNAFYQVADALGHIHERGYVHADMKPHNVIVMDDGRIKVIDLGQACKIGTIKERIQGTPDYIAPEQVHRREITPKTDIYNLGATMYWVLTRRNIPTAMAKGDSLLGSIDDSLLNRPEEPIAINPRIPEKLSDLIMQCVEPDPAKRPESMRFVADRLNLIEGLLRAKSLSVAATDDD